MSCLLGSHQTRTGVGSFRRCMVMLSVEERYQNLGYQCADEHSLAIGVYNNTSEFA